MIWWLSQPSRAQAERQGLADLRERCEWLTNVRWRLATGMRLAVDFDVAHADEDFPLTMIYAAFHPHAPPSVVPRDGRRLSGHQYGSGGDLCLEYRADNWAPSITGAMMVESAYRLIAGERTADVAGEVASAHRATLGQDTRGVSFRLLVTPAMIGQLENIQHGQAVDLAFTQKNYAGTFAVTLTCIGGVDVVPAWVQGEGALRTWPGSGRAVRLPPGQPLPGSPTLAGICESLAGLGLGADKKRFEDTGPSADLMLVSDGACQLYLAFDHKGARCLSWSRTVAVPEDGASRYPEDYASLVQKRVGVVGCGSLGSKIAATLARSGVRHFTLVDDDIFLPGNLVRNELAQLAVGVHKVDALRERLKEIAGPCDVRVRRIAFGGQESADTTESVMSDLALCDLLVDATADPQCFNFCAAVAHTKQTPMVWAEVFGGGIGGIVARVRPGKEPEPHVARNQIIAWCEARGVPAPAMAAPNPYGGSSPDGIPLTADDSEVSIIAAHAARLVIDVLVRLDASLFPASAYAVGLRAAWIFDAPFDTWPIGFSGSFEWHTDEDGGAVEVSHALLEELLPAGDNDDHQPAA